MTLDRIAIEYQSILTMSTDDKQFQLCLFIENTKMYKKNIKEVNHEGQPSQGKERRDKELTMSGHNNTVATKDIQTKELQYRNLL